MNQKQAATSRRIAGRPVTAALLALLALSFGVAGCDGDKKDEAESTVTVNERPPPEEGEGEGEAPADGEVEFEMEPSGAAGGDAEPTPRTPADFKGGPARATADGAVVDGGAAGDEAAPPARVERSASFLKVAPMLEASDVWKSLSYKGLLEQGDFVGQPPSKTYNATRLASENGGFGVALQVWKPGSAATATRRFDELYKNSIGGQRSKDVGDLSFRSEHHGLRSIVFLDKRRSAVAWVTCEWQLCEFEQLADLSRRIQRKL